MTYGGSRRAAGGGRRWLPAVAGGTGAVLLATGGFLLTRPPAAAAPALGGSTAAAAAPAPASARARPDAAPTAAAGRATATHLATGSTGAVAGPTARAASRPDPPGLPPVRLRLAAQGVLAPVEPVGVLPGGGLQVPDMPRTTGWWAGGAALGTGRGTVVVDGHLDSARRGPGALAALLRVRLGDPVVLSDSAGRDHRYRVTARRTYGKQRLPAEVFRTGGPARLVLITCGGVFDRSVGAYRSNVVVYATPAAQNPPTGG